jgi:hypothetical protein
MVFDYHIVINFLNSFSILFKSLAGDLYTLTTPILKMFNKNISTTFLSSILNIRHYPRHFAFKKADEQR